MSQAQTQQILERMKIANAEAEAAKAKRNADILDLIAGQRELDTLQQVSKPRKGGELFYPAGGDTAELMKIDADKGNPRAAALLVYQDLRDDQLNYLMRPMPLSHRRALAERFRTENAGRAQEAAGKPTPVDMFEIPEGDGTIAGNLGAIGDLATAHLEAASRPVETAMGVAKWGGQAYGGLQTTLGAVSDAVGADNLAKGFYETGDAAREWSQPMNKAQAVGASLPNTMISAAMAVAMSRRGGGPGARAVVSGGMTAYGIQAVGQGVEDYRSLKLSRGEEPNPWEALGVGAVYGAAELLAERAGLPPAAAASARLASHTADAMLKGGWRAGVQAFASAGKILVPNMTEEMATQLLQNQAMKAYDANRELLGGVWESGLSGALQAGGMAAGGLAAGVASRQRGTPQAPGAGGPEEDPIDQALAQAAEDITNGTPIEQSAAVKAAEDQLKARWQTAPSTGAGLGQGPAAALRSAAGGTGPAQGRPQGPSVAAQAPTATPGAAVAQAPLPSPSPSQQASPSPEVVSVSSPEDSDYETAKAIVKETGRPSVSLIQRRMSLGYTKAQELLNRMEADGMVQTDPTTGTRELVADSGKKAPELRKVSGRQQPAVTGVQIPSGGSIGPEKGPKIQDQFRSRIETTVVGTQPEPGSPRDIAKQRRTVAPNLVASALHTAQSWDSPAYIVRTAETANQAAGEMVVRREPAGVVYATVHPSGKITWGEGIPQPKEKADGVLDQGNPPGGVPAKAEEGQQEAKPEAVTREPWQMTRGEWVGGGTVGRIRFGDVDREFVESPQFDTPEEAKAWASSRGIANPQIQSSGKRGGPKLYKASGSTSVHRDAVESAHAAGKPVPPEVLAEYPDLVVDPNKMVNPSESPKSSKQEEKPKAKPAAKKPATKKGKEVSNGKEAQGRREGMLNKPAPTGATQEVVPAPAPGKKRLTDALSPEKRAKLAELEKALAKKLGTELRSGFDPEMFGTGVQIAALYLEAGYRTFSEFAQAMIGRMGATVRPYLRGIYIGASMMPGAPTGTDSPAAVEAFDLQTIDDDGNEVQQSSTGMPSRDLVSGRTAGGGSSITESSNSLVDQAPREGSQPSAETTPSTDTMRTTESEDSPEAITRVIGQSHPSGKKILQTSDDIGVLRQRAIERRPKLVKILNDVGYAFGVGLLQGPRVKSMSSLLRKRAKFDADAAEKNLPQRPNSTMSDVLGARVAIESVEDFQRFVDTLNAAGYQVIDDEDFTTTPKEQYAGYRARHIQVKLDDDFSAEVELVPRQLMENQEPLHVLFDAIRVYALKIKAGTHTEEEVARMERLIAESKRIYDRAWEDFLAHRETEQYSADDAVEFMAEPDLVESAKGRGLPTESVEQMRRDIAQEVRSAIVHSWGPKPPSVAATASATADAQKVLAKYKESVQSPDMPDVDLKTVEGNLEVLRFLGIDEKELAQSWYAIKDVQTLAEKMAEEARAGKSGNTTNPDDRDEAYRDLDTRRKLAHRLIVQLATMPMAANEEDVKLGQGGGVPATGVARRRKVWFVLGGPGAGKSTHIARIARENRALHVSCDIFKRMLPEYERVGAMGTHRESSTITDIAIDSYAADGLNMVIERTGKTEDDVTKYLDSFRERGYEVQVLVVHLPRAEATRRLVARFTTTGRLPSPIFAHNLVGDRALDTYAELAGKGYVHGGQVWNNFKRPPEVVTEFGGSRVRKSAGDGSQAAGVAGALQRQDSQTRESGRAAGGDVQGGDTGEGVGDGTGQGSVSVDGGERGRGADADQPGSPGEVVPGGVGDGGAGAGAGLAGGVGVGNGDGTQPAPGGRDVLPDGSVAPEQTDRGRGARARPKRSQAAAGNDAEQVRNPDDLPEAQRDFVLEAGKEPAPTTIATRTRANLRSIQLLKKLESEGRLPTADEKRILAAYSGWGSMSSIFDDSRDDTARLRAVLRQEITKEEWESARESTLNAHFTSGEVISAMWKMVDRLGFKGGRVLEPSAGAGSFFALQPQDSTNRSQRVAVELDSITGRILKHLYPQADVRVEGFQESPMSNNSFDLAISNVPFGSYKITGKDYRGQLIHDYFFLRSLDKVKPGGLVVFITSDGTMDKVKPEVRAMLTEKADLVGAIRMPNTAFVKSSGTSVTTDIVILRKKDASPFVGEAFGTLAHVGDWNMESSVDHLRDRIKTIEDLRESGALSLEDAGEKIDRIQTGISKLQEQIREENQNAEKEGRKPRGVPIMVNEYFARHPEMVLGTHSMAGEMYGADPDYALLPKSGMSNLGKAIEKAMVNLPENVLGATTRSKDLAKAAAGTARYGSTSVYEGEIVTVMGDKTETPIWMVERTTGKEPEEKITAAEAAERRDVATEWMPLRDAAVALVEAELRDEPAARLDQLRADLNRTYEAFRDKYGSLNRTQTFREPTLFLRADPDYYLVQSLEVERTEFLDKGVKVSKELKAKSPVTKKMEDGRTRVIYYDKQRIFTERANPAVKKPEKVDNLDDAIALSMSWHAKVDEQQIAEWLGRPQEDVRNEMHDSPRVFLDPTSGMWVTRELYLSGNVKSKLKIAKEQAQHDPLYERNVIELERVIPEDTMLAEVTMSPASKWIPDRILTLWVRHFLGNDSARVSTSDLSNSRSLLAGGSDGPEQYRATDHHSAVDTLQQMLTGTGAVTARMPERRVDSRGRGYTAYVEDKEGTALAKQHAKAMADEFRGWMLETDAMTTDDEGNEVSVQQLATRVFNDELNNTVPLNHDGSYLALPGVSGIVRRLAHRMSVVARILHDGAAVMAHGVGSGKTFSQIVAAMELKRLGLARKVMIVVAKPTVGQFAKEFRRAYPNARLIVADEASFTPRGRRLFMAQAALADVDAIIVTQPQFERISLTKAAQAGYLEERLREFRQALAEAQAEAAANGERSNASVKRLEAQVKSLEGKLSNLMEAATKKKDDSVYFEHLGVDFLMVDEAHAYKKPPIVTQLQGVKGVPTGQSQRALNMGMIVNHIQKNHGGRGVVFATGTPITNTLAEVYVMLKMATPNVLANAGITSFDSFAHTFAQAEQSTEYTPGGRFKRVTRLKKFVNGPELSKLIRSGFDVKMGNKELGLIVPEVEGGGPDMRVLPKPDANVEFEELISMAADLYEGMDAEDRAEMSHIPLVLYTLGSRAAVDARLVNPNAPDDPESKVNNTVRELLKVHKETEGIRGTQLVFLDRFSEVSTATLEGFLGGDADPHAGDGTLSDDGGTDVDEVLEGDDDAEDADDKAAKKAEDKAYKKAKVNLYRDMKEKLIAGGVPAEQIAIIHDYTSDAARTELFDDFNSGKIRILMGSTGKMGTGVNVQARVVAAYNMDPPLDMTPAGQEQRDGRYIRQGNVFATPTLEDGSPNPEYNPNFRVKQISYGYEASMDTAIWQLILNKMKFARQALMGQMNGREFDDPNDSVTMSLKAFRAALTGDERVLRQVDLENEIHDLESELGAIQRKAGSWKAKIDESRSEVAQLLRNTQELDRQQALQAPIIAQMNEGEYTIDFKGNKGRGPADMNRILGAMVKDLAKAFETNRAKRVEEVNEKMRVKLEAGKTLKPEDIEFRTETARTADVKLGGQTWKLQVSHKAVLQFNYDAETKEVAWLTPTGGSETVVRLVPDENNELDVWRTHEQAAPRVVNAGVKGWVTQEIDTEDLAKVDADALLKESLGKVPAQQRRTAEDLATWTKRMNDAMAAPKPVFLKHDELKAKRQEWQEIDTALNTNKAADALSPSGFYKNMPIRFRGSVFTVEKVSERPAGNIKALWLRTDKGTKFNALPQLAEHNQDPLTFLKESQEEYWQMIQPKLDAMETENMGPTEKAEIRAMAAELERREATASEGAADAAEVATKAPTASSIIQAAGRNKTWGNISRLERGDSEDRQASQAADEYVKARPMAAALLQAAGRLESWAARQVALLRSSQGMMRRKAGSRSGHNALMTDVVRVVGIVAARGISRGITKGVKLSQLVNTTIAELAPDMATQAKAIRRGAKKFLAATTPATFERDFADLVAPPLGKGARAKLTRQEAQARVQAIGQIVNPAEGTVTMTESEALAGALKGQEKAAGVAQERTEKRAVRELKKEMRRAFNHGAQAGRREARAKLQAVYKRVIAFRRMLGQWHTTEKLDEYRAAQAVRDGIRDQVKEYARTLPVRVRGKVLGAIVNATTPAQYVQAIRKLDRELNRALIRTSVSWIARATRRSIVKSGRGMTDPLRALLAQARTRAAAIRSRAADKDVDLNELQAMEAEAAALKAQIASELKTARDAIRDVKGVRAQNVEQALAATLQDITAARKPMKADNTEQDAEVSAARRIWRGARDIRNTMQELTGKIGSTMEKWFYDRFERAESAMFERKREIQTAMERAFRRAGFKGIADAQRIMSGYGGDGNTRVIEAVLGGVKRKITLGELVDIIGHWSDPMTQALIEAGAQQFQSSRGRRRLAFDITPNEIRALIAQHDPRGRWANLVQDLKAVSEMLRPDAWAVHYTLQGYEPEAVPGRWPRARNLMGASVTAELPTSPAQFGQKFLENDGMFESRNQTTGVPILLRDPVSMMLDQTDRTLRTIYLAVPTRDASHLILDPVVGAAITERHGGSLVESIQNHLVQMSRAQVVVGTKWGRFIGRLRNATVVGTLAFNIGTWAVTTVSALRVLPMVGARDFSAGVASLPRVTMQYIQDRSGYFWDRYANNRVADRYAAAAGAPPQAQDNAFMAEVVASFRNLKARDIPGAWASLGRAMETTMAVINWTDSITSRIAWGAFEARAKRKHPNWTAAQREKWVEFQARRAVREAQQGSSPLDMALGPASVRETGNAAWFLFSSDVFKSRNRITRAFRHSKARGAAALAAEVSAAVIGNYVRSGLWAAVSYGTAAALGGGDDDDRDRILAQYMAADRLAVNAGRDLAGVALPLMGSRIVDVIQSPMWASRDRVIDAPILSSLDEAAAAATDALKRSMDDDETTARVLAAWGRFLNSASGASGRNPFAPIIRRVLREYEHSIAE